MEPTRQNNRIDATNDVRMLPNEFRREEAKKIRKKTAYNRSCP